MARRTILAHDTFVVERSPATAAVLCLLTGGITGAVHHFRITDELRRYGRARGRMPFAFVPVAPGASTLAWVVGLLAWYLVAFSVVAWVVGVIDGTTPSTGDVTTFTSLALLLAPLWLVAANSIRRIRTAQHLAGVEGPWPSPVRGALLAALFPPLGTWNAQRQLNRAWDSYQ
jgi:hypothetical protein